MGESEMGKRPRKEVPETDNEKKVALLARENLRMLIQRWEERERFNPGGFNENTRELNGELKKISGFETDLTFHVVNNRDRKIRVDVIVDGVQVNAGDVMLSD